MSKVMSAEELADLVRYTFDPVPLIRARDEQIRAEARREVADVYVLTALASGEVKEQHVFDGRIMWSEVCPVFERMKSVYGGANVCLASRSVLSIDITRALAAQSEPNKDGES